MVALAIIAAAAGGNTKVGSQTLEFGLAFATLLSALAIMV